MSNSIERSKLNAEKDIVDLFANTIVFAILVNHKSNDKLSTWVMGGSAALLGLLLANIDKIKGTFSIVDLRFMYGLVICSVLCGLVQKVFSMRISFEVTASEYTKEHVIEINNIRTQYDIDIERSKFIETFKEILPFPMSYYYTQYIKTINAPKNEIHKARISYFFHQTLWLFFQLLFLFVFIIFSVFAI